MSKVKKMVKKVKKKLVHTPLFLELLQKKDINGAAKLLTEDEVTYLVNSYYLIQDQRVRFNNQCYALDKENKPHDVLLWFLENSQKMEDTIKKVLDAFSMSKDIGVWSRKLIGIGPVIASGLMSHIDITKAPTAGHIWSFAGLNPKVVWEKGKKRPWNADLKTLVWKAGKSFVFVNSKKTNMYKILYYERKEKETKMNLDGKYKKQALEKVKILKKSGKTSSESYIHYTKGFLPPGHIEARAKRWMVKIFISHWFEAAYKFHYKKKPPIPYMLTKDGHVHEIKSPIPVTIGKNGSVTMGDLV